MALTVELGGVNKTSITKFDDFRVEWKLGAQATGRVRIFDTASGLYRPTLGHQAVVKDGSTPIWGGSIDEHRDSWRGATVLYYDLTLVGYELRLAKRVINALAYGHQFFTTNAISDLFTLTSGDNPFQNGYPVAVRTSDTLPAPLDANTVYYVVNRTSTTLQLSLTPGGSAINLTDDGTGLHYLAWYCGAVFSNLATVYGGAEGLSIGTVRPGAVWEPGSPFVWANVAEMLSRLAARSGFVWFVSPDGLELNFVPGDEFTAPFDITDSSSEVLFNGLQFRHTREQKANRVYVRIAEEAFSDTLVNFTGDGAKRLFRVATVIKSMTSINLNATPQEIGIYGVDTDKAWYYTPGSQWIIQDGGGTTLTGSDTLSVFYRAEGFDARTAEDTGDQSAVAAVETGTSGIYEAVQQDTSILSADGGDASAASLLASLLTNPVEVEYYTRSRVLPGQVQSINLTIHDINQDFLIDTVEATLDSDANLRYRVRAISTTRLGDALSLFRALLGGGSGAGGATISTAEGGGGAEVEPGNVVAIGANAFDVAVALDYSYGAGVPLQAFSIEYDVPDPIGTLAGVTLYVVLPSGETWEVMSPPYNGDEGGVGAARHGTFIAYVPLASSSGQSWDLYLASWSATFRKPLDTATTPKRIITALSSTVGLVTGFSIAANYSDDGSVLVVEPTLTPPSADPNFWYSEIWMKTPYWEGQLGESDGSPIQFNVGGGFPPTPPGTDETWDFYAVSVGRNQTKNPSAFDIITPSGAAHATALISPQPVAGTVPALPTTVVGSHVASGQDATTQQLRVKLRATITYPLGSTATIVTIWLSLDNGSTWEFAVNDEAMATVDFWWAAPETTVTTAKLKVITANQYGWNDPGAAVVSAAFTITAGAAVASNAITDAVQVGATSYAKNSDGQWIWGFTVQWTNPDTATNPNFFTTKLYARKEDAGGTPASDWEGAYREVAQRAAPGVVSVTEIGWRVLGAGDSFPYYALYLVCVNQTFQETPQTTAWGGNPKRFINPQEPSGSSGYEYSAHITSPTASVEYYTDEQGALMARITGGFTAPIGDYAYGGTRVIARPSSGSDLTLAHVPRPGNTYVSVPVTVPESPVTYTIYFVSFDTSNRQNTLVPGTTPSVSSITVQRTAGAAGQEHAPLVTGFFAYSPAAVGYYGEDGAQRYQFSGIVTPPAGGKYKGMLVKACPKGTISATNASFLHSRQSGGYFFAHHVNQKIDVAGVQMTITSVISPTQIQTNVMWSSSSGTWVVILLSEARIVADIGPTDTFWNSNRYEVQHDSEEWRLYAISYDYSGRENSLVPGTTPQSDVTVNRLTGASGREYTDVVTSIVPSESSPGIKCIVFNSESGETQWLVSGTGNEPTGTRAALFGGVKICRLNPSNPNGSIEIANVERTGTGTFSFRSAIQPTLGAANVPIIFLCYDTSGRINTYVNGVTPEFTAITPGQSVSLRLDKVDPATMNVAPIASYIIPPMNLASLPSLPNAAYPAGRMVYRTSDNTMWRVSTSGFSFENVPLGNSAFFKSVTALQIAAGAIGTYELAAQEILVGSPSGGGGATKFRVNDAFGTMVCAIGDFGTFKGFHAINARIGPNINAPNFFADGSQVYLEGVRFTQNLGNNVVVSIKNEFAQGGFTGVMVHEVALSNAVILRPGDLLFAASTSGALRARLYTTSPIGPNLEMYSPVFTSNVGLRLQVTSSGADIHVMDSGGSLRTGQSHSVQLRKADGGVITLVFTAGVNTNWF